MSNTGKGGMKQHAGKKMEAAHLLLASGSKGPEVPEIVAYFEKDLVQLEDLFQRLASKLAIVTSSGKPVPSTAAERTDAVVAMPYETQLANNLASMRNYFNNLVRDLSDLCDRIEL